MVDQPRRAPRHTQRPAAASRPQFWGARAQFEAAGVKLVCVAHEWIDREVRLYLAQLWASTVWLF
jgi:hypothetical protein